MSSGLLIEHYLLVFLLVLCCVVLCIVFARTTVPCHASRLGCSFGFREAKVEIATLHSGSAPAPAPALADPEFEVNVHEEVEIEM